MIEGVDARARNRRLAIVLLAIMAFLCLGSMAYIDWFHSVGPGAVAAREK